MDNNRRTAFLIIRDVEEKKAYSHIAVNNYVSRMRPDSPPFVRELTYGVLREKLYLDYIITCFVRTPLEKTEKSDLILLRMGLYQILRMDSVPDYAAINETVELAKKYSIGHDGFINGVLRQYLRDREYVNLPDRREDEVRYLSLKYSYAPWIVKMWTKEFGKEDAEKLLKAGNVIPEINIRVNQLKNTKEDLYRRLAARGYKVSVNPAFDNSLRVSNNDLLGGRFYKSGLYSIQDEGSIAVVEALDPQPGQKVVDVCAAPGGKTMAIAEKMHNNGEIIATDIYKRKLRLIKEQAQRLGVNIVKTWSWDGARTDSDLVDTADRVLVDAPCSGLGTVRKKPEIKYKAFDGEVEKLPAIQKDILSASAPYVKPGGILVYATCTLSERENQQVTDHFLGKRRDFEKVESRLLLPGEDDSDGFYICKMKRKD